MVKETLYSEAIVGANTAGKPNKRLYTETIRIYVLVFTV